MFSNNVQSSINNFLWVLGWNILDQAGISGNGSNSAYNRLFLPIPAYSRLFQSIIAYPSLFQHISVSSSQFQPSPASVCLFQLITAYSRPIPAYSSLCQRTQGYFPIPNLQSPIPNLLFEMPHCAFYPQLGIFSVSSLI